MIGLNIDVRIFHVKGPGTRPTSRAAAPLCFSGRGGGAVRGEGGKPGTTLEISPYILNAAEIALVSLWRDLLKSSNSLTASKCCDYIIQHFQERSGNAVPEKNQLST